MLSLVVATVSCSQSELGSCEPQERLAGWSEIAADRALTCDIAIEVDGMSYHFFYDTYGCVEVDAQFLGNSIAFGEGVAARSIEGVPRHVALALVFPPGSEMDPVCPVWNLWYGSELTRQEDRILQEVVCRVRPPGKPDPQSCTETSDSATV